MRSHGAFSARRPVQLRRLEQPEPACRCTRAHMRIFFPLWSSWRVQKCACVQARSQAWPHACKHTRGVRMRCACTCAGQQRRASTQVIREGRVSRARLILGTGQGGVIARLARHITHDMSARGATAVAHHVRGIMSEASCPRTCHVRGCHCTPLHATARLFF